MRREAKSFKTAVTMLLGWDSEGQAVVRIQYPGEVFMAHGDSTKLADLLRQGARELEEAAATITDVGKVLRGGHEG